MAGFEDIVGHDQIIAHLKAAIAEDRVSHAYIFDGPDHSGKRLLAEAFAMALQCRTIGRQLHGEEPEQMSLFDMAGMTGSGVSREAEERAGRMEPCMECLSCKQAVNGSQPDIIRVTRVKSVLSVDDIRKQINSDVAIRPYSSRYKVYIVDEAERMNTQAQNALLKTLEEPPEYVVILLLCANADSFLPTILSRCVRLNLKPVDSGRIRSFLMRQQKVPDYKADLCVAFAQGNVGRAVMLASSEQFGEIKDRTLALIGKLDRQPLCDVSEELNDIIRQKENISIFTDLILLLFRDVLLYKSTGSADGIVFKGEEKLVGRLAGGMSFAELNDIFAGIDRAERRISMNVSPGLTLEILLLDIKERLRP